MTRLFVHVEGSTEEDFVNEILRPHLRHHGYSSVSARLMGDARQRSRRGGIRGWPMAKRSFVRHLREDAGSIDAAMVDYYGLPQRGFNAWPGRAVANSIPIPDRAKHIENEIRRELMQDLGDNFSLHRFFPHVMMHEFEAMLFSDCALFAQSIGHPELEQEFQAIVEKCGVPEKINDTSKGAPSRRIEQLVEDYEKPIMGVLAALEIGLDKIRTACPHFNDWLTRLEQLPQVPQ